MSEDLNAEVPAAEPAPAPQELAPVEATQDADTGDDASPADGHDDDGEDPKPKGGFQRRISELTYRVRDTERDRDHWRDLALQQTRQTPQPQYEPEPQYADDGYEPAQPAVDPRAIISTVRQQIEVEQRLASFNERVAKEFSEGEPEGIAALKRAPPELVTPALFDLVTGSDQAPKVAEYLGMNQAELRRLAALPPHRQGLEFARLEARISEQKPATTKAPAPPPSIGARASAVEADPDKMSTEQWLKWRDAQLRK